MLRPVLDRKLDVLRRGVSGHFDTIVAGKHNVPCQYGARQSTYLGENTGGRAEPTIEYMLIWDPAIEITENDRIRMTQKRVAGQWQPLSNEPLYVLVQGSIQAPEVNGVTSHREARIAREGG